MLRYVVASPFILLWLALLGGAAAAQPSSIDNTVYFRSD